MINQITYWLLLTFNSLTNVNLFKITLNKLQFFNIFAKIIKILFRVLINSFQFDKKTEGSTLCIKVVLLVVFALFPHWGWAVTETLSHSVSFSIDNFLFEDDDNGYVHIVSNDYNAVYPESNVPGLPLFSLSVAIPGDVKYLSSHPRYTKRLIRTNVQIAQSPLPTPTNALSSSNLDPAHTYVESVYPVSNCQYTMASEWDNVKVLHFQLCPFVYNAIEKNLYFIDRIDLDITTCDDNLTASRSCINNDVEVLKKLVANADVAESILSNTAKAQVQDGERVDYVIITSNSLKDAFEPLLKWKKMKGIYAKIATIESIEAKFRGYGTQFAIKCYLYELYHRNSLKYALLGGDDTVVPVRGCYGRISSSEGVITDSVIPTDMYYACYGGDFTWDGNGNGVYGETTDNLNLAQSVYVSRVPVRTPTDVEAFVNKLIEYEKNPKWTNRMLMGGYAIGGLVYGTSMSDAEAKGDNLYENYINPYWQGERYKLYDTATDFPGGSDYDFTAENLSYQISQGYNFIDIITHGNQVAWAMENYPYNVVKYDSTLGSNQTNSVGTIITTIACFTNAFDSSYGGRTPAEDFIQDPCLSESLIRNAQSGVIAYLGCSREGLEYGRSSSIGPTMKYETHFFKNLFDSEFSDKNYAKLVSASKAAMVSNCSYDGSYRWTLFGLNPIGDPEMPIFTEEPKTLNCSVLTIGQKEVTVRAGQGGCRICVMSSADNGESYYQVIEDASTATFSDFPTNSSLCVTKPGYIPKIYGKIPYLPGLITNKITNFAYDNGSGVATIGIQLEEDATSPQIIVSDIMGNTESCIDILSSDSEIAIDASSIRSGVHIVSLIVDGGLADNCRFVK